jgi:hypothetical protein
MPQMLPLKLLVKMPLKLLVKMLLDIEKMLPIVMKKVLIKEEKGVIEKRILFEIGEKEMLEKKRETRKML